MNGTDTQLRFEVVANFEVCARGYAFMFSLCVICSNFFYNSIVVRSILDQWQAADGVQE